LLAEHTNRADKLTFLKHRHRHIGPRTGDFDEGNNASIFPNVRWVVPQVADVDYLFSVSDAIEGHSRIITWVNHGIAPPRIDVAFCAVDRNRTKDWSIAQEQISKCGLTDVSCILQYGIEDRRKLAGRT